MFSILLLSIIIYLSIIFYYKYRHPFWYQQPVDFLFTLDTDEGRIGMLDYNHRYKKGFSCSTWSNKENILEFLNNHFQPGGYTFSYTDSCLNNCYFFKISRNDEICGCISAKSIYSSIKGIKQQIFYVDHLVVKGKYQGQGLATDLIACVLDSIGDHVYLFKKDIQPLPFKYFCKYKYYEIKDIGGEEQPNEIEDMDLSKINGYEVLVRDNENLIFLEHEGTNSILFYTNMTSKGKPIFEISCVENKQIAELSVNFIRKNHPTSIILVNEISGTNKFYKTKYLSENYLYFYNYRLNAVNPKNIFLSLP